MSLLPEPRRRPHHVAHGGGARRRRRRASAPARASAVRPGRLRRLASARSRGTGQLGAEGRADGDGSCGLSCGYASAMSLTPEAVQLRVAGACVAQDLVAEPRPHARDRTRVDSPRAPAVRAFHALERLAGRRQRVDAARARHRQAPFMWKGQQGTMNEGPHGCFLRLRSSDGQRAGPEWRRDDQRAPTRPLGYLGAGAPRG